MTAVRAALFNPHHDELGRFSVGDADAGRELTKDEAKALRSYSQYGYYDINRSLRNKSEADWAPPTAERIHNMDTAFDAAVPLARPATVYRGVQNPSLNVGDIFTDAGFVSTSLSADSANVFSRKRPGKAIVAITLPKGARVLNFASRLGGRIHKDEREILLPRGSRFRVLAVNQPRASGHIPEYYVELLQ